MTLFLCQMGEFMKIINKKLIVGMCLGTFAFMACAPVSIQTQGLQERLISISNNSDVSDIASSVRPAIVAINGISEEGESVGSGVCVASGGYLLTNSHVVNDCQAINIILADKQRSTASIVYEDTVLDLAILKSDVSLPYLEIGDSDELSVGNDVLAVGTPLSLSLTHTFTKGIISALNRTLKVGSTNGSGYMQNLIQHDASLNPGNSGGPLLNSKGQVIGINTLKISGGEGIGFAIPAKSFASLLDSLVDNINYQIPYLGVFGYDSEIAEFYNQSDINYGFYVIDIADTSPLYNAGVKSSSIITSLNGKPIRNTLDLKDELYSLDANSVVDLEFYYQGNFYQITTSLSQKN